MIRRLAARAAAVDLPLLVLATAGSASIVMGWTLAVAAWTVPTGIPPVTLAMVALLPLCGVVQLLMSFALPRPALAGRPAPAVAAPPVSPALPGATAPAPSEGSGAGAWNSQRGGEGRDVQPPPAVAALAGARSRRYRDPVTLPVVERGPGCRTAAGHPGPHAPSRSLHGWDAPTRVTSPYPGRGTVHGGAA